MVIQRLILLGIVLSSLNCVYFNTYYNAQKFFRQAEKQRKIETEDRISLGESRDQTQSLSNKTNALYEKAAQKAWAVMEKFPESDLVDDAAFLMARAFHWQGNYLYSIRTLQDLEEKYPESEFLQRARYWKGLSYEKQKDPQAGDVYRQLFTDRINDLSDRAGYRLGVKAYNAEEYAVAVQEYNRTLEAFPESPLRAELYLRLGEALFAMEDSLRYEESLSAFYQVRRESPSDEIDYESRLNSGNVLQAQGNLDGAQAGYAALLSESRFRPFEGETRLAIGQLYQDSHLPQEALAEFEQVRDDFPSSESSAMALYRTGLLYLQEYGDTQRAEEYFKETRAEKKNSRGAKLSRQMLKELGTLEKLRRRIRRADSLAVAKVKRKKPAASKSEPVESDALASNRSVLDTAGVTIDTLLSADIEDLKTPALSDSAMKDTSGLMDAVALIEDLPSVEDELSEGSPDVGDGDQSPAWFFRKRSKGEKAKEVDPKLLDDLYSMAEAFRVTVEQPDSALHYYGEIIRRYPDSDHVVRALYALGWVHHEMKDDAHSAELYFEQLLTHFPASEHANAARGHMGQQMRVTDEEAAAEEFLRVEQLAIDDPGGLETHIQSLESLSVKYPSTKVGAKALFLAAWRYENAGQDSVEALKRYDRLLEEFPSSRYAELVKERRKGRKQGVVDKLEREIKSLGGGFNPGEYVRAIAIEPDSVDTAALAIKHSRFALRAYNRGNLEKAREHCELSLEQRRRNPDALYYLGRSLWDEGYTRDAIDRYHEVFQYSRNHIGTAYGLMYAYIADGAADSANYYLHQIIARDSGNPQIQYLVEAYPEVRPSEREDLDMDVLESLDLSYPVDNLQSRQSSLRFSEAPIVRRSFAAEYPDEANDGADAMGDSVDVVLDILIDRQGKPEQIEVFAGEQPFIEPAKTAAGRYQFYPARIKKGRREITARVWVELVIPIIPPPDLSAADFTPSDLTSQDTVSVLQTVSEKLLIEQE